MTELTPIETLINRIEFLIREDPRLNVVETIGALHMIAYRLSAGAINNTETKDDNRR